MSYGEKYGVANVGSFAVDCIRISNKIPSYGSEIKHSTDFNFVESVLNGKQVQFLYVRVFTIFV